MDWTQQIRSAARHAGHPLDDDVVEELATHAQAAFDAACSKGMSFDEAGTHVRSLVDQWIREAASLKRISRVQAAIEPPAMTSGLLSGLVNDVRYSVRLLARQRSFTIVAVLTMALSIGVMTTLFSVLYGVLLSPLPWPEPERLVRLAEKHVGATRDLPWTMTNSAYLPWMEKPSTIEAAAAWSRTTLTLSSANGTSASERVSVTSTTASAFPLVHAKPLVGQVFTADDRKEVVLSYGLWKDRFGADPGAVGQNVQLNGTSYAIVGVMPADFVFPDRDTRLWRPFKVPPSVSPDGKEHTISAFNAMARLRRGVTPEQVSAEATAMARNAPDLGMVAMAMFGTSGAANIKAVPVLDAMTEDVKPALLAMFVAVVLLLVTAVANIASLQLARATTRHREMAIRSAIGAKTVRLAQQLIAENVVLAVIGGIAGVLVSLGLHRALPSILPPDFPRLHDIALNLPVALFALFATIIAGISLGVLPAWHLTRVRLIDGLSDNSTGVIGSRRGRARSLIMIGQVAIACALLVGGGLLIRSLNAMMTKDLGFSSTNVLTARLGLPDFAFTQARRLDTVEQFLERARTLPGRPAVALTTGLPMSGSENLTAFSMPSLRPPVGKEITVNAVRSVVTPGYFDAIGIRLAQGRLFTDADNSASAAKVVVVNRTFARQFLTPAAVGDRLRNFMTDDGIDYEVIGIVDDTIRRTVTDVPQPEIYSMLRQSSTTPNYEVVIRTTGDPTTLVQPLRSLVSALSPAATLETVRTMDARIASSLARPRLYAEVLAAFALSALAIASVGLFGVLSFIVAQRTREIALRCALGARPAQIFGLVFRYGIAVTVAGLAAGLLVAYESVRYLGSLLYGVSTHDVWTFVIAPALIAAIALIASIVPARRALKVDPLTALRRA